MGRRCVSPDSDRQCEFAQYVNQSDLYPIQDLRRKTVPCRMDAFALRAEQIYEILFIALPM
jgi:hypothetical protein